MTTTDTLRQRARRPMNSSLSVEKAGTRPRDAPCERARGAHPSAGRMAMKGLLLSGGSGTRLRPLTHSGPKQLIPVANKPVLIYALEDLQRAGITDIAVILGLNGREQVIERIGDGSQVRRERLLHRSRRAARDRARGRVRRGLYGSRPVRRLPRRQHPPPRDCPAGR